MEADIIPNIQLYENIIKRNLGKGSFQVRFKGFGVKT